MGLLDTPSWTSSGRFVGLQSRRWRCCPCTWMMMFSSRCGVFHGTFVGIRLKIGWHCIQINSPFHKWCESVWISWTHLISFIFMCKMCSGCNNYDIIYIELHQIQTRLKAAAKKHARLTFALWDKRLFSRARFVVVYRHLQRDPFNKRLWVYKRPMLDRWARMTPEVRDATCWCLAYSQFVQFMCLSRRCYHRKYYIIDLNW